MLISASVTDVWKCTFQSTTTQQMSLNLWQFKFHHTGKSLHV